MRKAFRRGLRSAIGMSYVLTALALPLAAADSDPKPAPKGGPLAQAIAAYNEGVALMLERRYADAQARFEAALAIDATLADAHNNLGYSLRKQGTANYARALEHYNRALALDPALARAYMYRGVLFTQMGDFGAAKADLERLRPMDAKLAARLEAAIEGRPDPGTHEALSPQRE